MNRMKADEFKGAFMMEKVIKKIQFLSGNWCVKHEDH